MMRGPRAATAHVNEKLGGMTTSGIIMRPNLVTFRSATGVVDSRLNNGFSDQLSKLSTLEATFNDVVRRRLGAAMKAEATWAKESNRVSFMVF